MGEHNPALAKEHAPCPGSPTREDHGQKRSHEELSGPETPSPEAKPQKKQRLEGSHGSSLRSKKIAKKKPQGEGSSNPNPHPQPQRNTDDKNPQARSSNGSRSVPFELDRMVANMETMVEMVKRVIGTKGLTGDPVMDCFVSAQTVIMACTAELISRRATQPRVGHTKESSTNAAAKTR